MIAFNTVRGAPTAPRVSLQMKSKFSEITRFAMAWSLPAGGKKTSMGRALWSASKSLVDPVLSTALVIDQFLRAKPHHPTPVFLPAASQGQRSLVGCHLQGHTKSDTTEVTSSNTSITLLLTTADLKQRTLVLETSSCKIEGV